MKSIFHNIIVILLFGLAVLPAQAAFKALYVLGDSLSATADPNAPGGSYYYGQRWSNGRVWVEVLAQRQGLAYNTANNNSYWDHNSTISVTDVKNFAAPTNVANDLFIVWVCNADTFDTASALLYNPSYPYINANMQSQTNHLQIITNLYAKGVRTLIMPNAVDLSKIPAFNAGTLAPTIHAECVDYNTRFSNTIKQARALCPGLTIYTPDFYTLMNNVLTNAGNYGLTNALSAKGYSIDAYSDPAITALTLNAQGTNFIFWDSHDPTAEFHEVIADVVQQIVSPVQVGQITALNGSNQMVVANMPVGLNGFVDAATNLTQPNWTVVQNITSTSTTQLVFAPQLPTTTSTNVGPAFAGGGAGAKPADSGGGLLGGSPPNYTALEFYRLRFPYAWTWP